VTLAGLNNRGNLGDRAWRWDAATGTTDIGSLDGAFLYRGGEMLDLTRLAADPSWVLQEANGINGNGLITGVGLHNGRQRAFLLEPWEDRDNARLP
jgi:hypothetical protein